MLRRQRIDLSTPAEIAIRQAIATVERAGCHPKLTDAGMKLVEALTLVADVHEASMQHYPECHFRISRGLKPCSCEGVSAKNDLLRKAPAH